MSRIVRRAKLHRCAALDWDRKEGGPDYVECIRTEGQRCRVEGLLLAVEVPLCRPHQEHFREKWRAEVTPLWDSETEENISLAEAETLPANGGIVQWGFA
jgi:hypothetical protein